MAHRFYFHTKAEGRRIQVAQPAIIERCVLFTELSRSLDENARARAFLTQVLERLPCGVVVSRSGGEIRLSNPEARRLLEMGSPPIPGSIGGVPMRPARNAP